MDVASRGWRRPRWIATACLAFCLFACSSQAKPDREPAQAPLEQLYADAVTRLFEHFYDHGYIVSRSADGAAQHVGEGLLWSGVALGNLPCDRAKQVMADLSTVMTTRNGEIRRYEPLPQEYAGRELNFDGETGLVYGFARFLQRCPNDTGGLSDAWRLHWEAIRRNDGQLYPGTGERMPGLFAFTTNALSVRLGLIPAVDVREQDTMEQAAASWATAVKLQRAACYRVNLAFMHIQAAEALGYPLSDLGRSMWCSATKGMGIATVDFYCGQSEILTWINAFEFNRFEYAHQRCSAWEMADGNGLETPGLDLITAMSAGFDF